MTEATLIKQALEESTKAKITGMSHALGGPAASTLSAAISAPKGKKLDSAVDSALHGSTGAVLGATGGGALGGLGGAAIGALAGAAKHALSDDKTTGFWKKKSKLPERVAKGALLGAGMGMGTGAAGGGVIGAYQGAKHGYEKNIKK